MNLIQLQKGSKSYGSRTLFDDATFAINEGEHVGVIGPNGAGKTTLFRILNNEEELDNGTITRSKELKIGYLEQEVEWRDDETLEDYLSSCSLPIWELKSLARGLGLDDEKFNVPLLSLSGGYRMRCKLLYLIGCEPNLMMLDEPTNYLDLETLLVLEQFLQSYRGSFLLISHDREFLKRTTDHTLEIESEQVTKYPGNIDEYFEQKALLREQLEKQALSDAAKRKEILDFVARFGAKANKASQAQSRLKMLGRMEKIEIKPLPVTAKINIPQPSRIGKKAIFTKDLSLGYGEKTVLSGINLSLIRGDKIGIVGYNGVGKSTLLKGLTGNLKPQNGSVEYGKDVQIGYYAQHVTEELNFENTVFEELERAASLDIPKQEILDLAGSLLFSGDHINKKVSYLSGGEKARVALGKILLMKSPLLVMDEVTNHLDFNTVEALTQALNRYEGTLIIVSHDRGFTRRVTKKILEIRDGKVLEYLGSYDEYIWSIEKAELSEKSASPVKKNKKLNSVSSENSTISHSSTSSKNSREEKKILDRQIRQIEKKCNECEEKISSHQKRIEVLNDKIASATDDSTHQTAALLDEIGKLSYEVIALEENWMKSLEEKERIKKELDSF